MGYALTALGLGLLTTGSPAVPTGSGTVLYVVTNGVHTDLVVPVRSPVLDWSVPLPYRDFGRVDSTFQYVSFGWGDQGFYLNTPTWNDLTAGTAFRALFGLGPSAMHVGYWQRAPAVGAHSRRLVVSDAQYRALVGYIRGSFQTDAAGRFQPLAGAHYDAEDAFYVAHGRYNLLRTCNVWTNGGLRQLGVRTPVWSPFDQPILWHLPQN